MSRVHGFFTEGTTREYWIIGISVGMNIGLIVFCMVYLVLEFHASGITWLGIAGSIAIGYFVTDFASGLVHWGIDTWFSVREFGRAVAMTREHHTHPQNILAYGFFEQSALGSAPSAVFVGVTHSAFGVVWNGSFIRRLATNRAAMTGNGSAVTGKPERC